jgi:hypothetical protein
LANGASATIALAAMFVDPQLTNTVTVGSSALTDLDAANNVATSTAAIECGTTAVGGQMPSSSLPARVTPNPAHAGATIQYATASGGTNAVEVFDVHGRLIRSLSSQAESGGNRSIYWDDLDQGGHPVPAGTYFYRVLDHDLVINEGKLVLIK